jgi:hypothetical protein
VVLSLRSLSDHDCEQMIAACLAGARLGTDLTGFIAVHSDGLPFLVEELLAGLVSSGALVHRNGEWRTEHRLRPHRCRT